MFIVHNVKNCQIILIIKYFNTGFDYNFIKIKMYFQFFVYNTNKQKRLK